ncbi:Uncharacterized protein PECH_006136 [Penicillium ucsense]|uniref:PH domain-containing protein n=1 Tax=Penicillium ucsense TaxID=2839758 RepID=A0A8J8W1U3_9EURO|nr:Uncharacterized protein PECM_006609 [Penicillium ucsense]KAF7735783.1 Uncharacterized protein PECH_006136 [Penicillium ucsense]
MGDHQRSAPGAPPSNAPPRAAEDAGNKQQNPSIARSMSRYRRNRPVVAVDPAAPPTPAAPSSVTAIAQRSKAQCLFEQQENRIPLASNGNQEREKEQHRQNAMAQLTGEAKSNKPPPPQLSTTSPSKARQARPDLPTEKTSTREDPVQKASSRTNPMLEWSPTKDPAAPSDQNRKSILQKVGLSRAKASQPQINVPPTGSAKPNYIAIGGGGIVPGTDAPVSAVNSGERLVMVKYGDKSARLPVTPSTNVQDLLDIARARISRHIDPNAFLLIESFQQIGLERPLRRYERVRDVLNSWAADADGALLAVPASSREAVTPLEASSVLSEKPPHTTVCCYYSHRPRKWDKRFVTLHRDGQVTVSKKEGSKDSADVCHLSDFDIYTPLPRYAAKEIKAPKKICFAIKSQQKSSMFLSTDSFVHFFSTNDRALGDQWYQAVQRWRSWYLVHKVRINEPVAPNNHYERNPSLIQSATRNLPPAQDVPRIPALNRQNSEPEPAQRLVGRQHAEASVSRRKTTREHRPPPSSFPATLTLDTRLPSQKAGSISEQSSPEEDQGQVFASTGLLGKTYTQRQHAMREREDRAKKAHQDPSTNTGLIGANSGSAPSTQPNSRTNTLTRADHGDRSMSIGQGQKPLVDLTPKFVEQPQHLRKGRGVRVEPGRQLIEAATGPEPIPGVASVPSSTTWKRPTVEPPSQSHPHRSNTTKSGRPSNRAAPHNAGPTSAGPVCSSYETFIANSLLANADRNPSTQPHHGKVSLGRGVATGDRDAARPLLDMSDENPFAEGSLLKKL